jgi:type I restriction enzyme S subunit
MREHLTSSTPPEWRIETIGSLAKTLSAGGTPSRANPAFWNGTNPFVLIEDITGCGLYLDSTRGTISDEGLTASSAWLVPAGAVLVSMYATIGATAVTRIAAATNQAIAAIIPRQGVHAEFLAFSIRHYRDALSARNVQSTQKNINKGILESFEIPVPPPDEQRKIAAVLGKVQAAVSVEGDLVRVARELKQAALRQLFTRGLRHEPQKQTTLGPVPESWVEVRVDTLGEVVTGTTPKTAERENYEGGTFDFISPGDISIHGQEIRRAAKKITEAGMKKSRVLPKGTSCFVCIGSTIGKVGITTQERSATNQQINAVIPGKGFDAHFVFYTLLWNSERITSRASPSPVPIMSKSLFSEPLVWVTRDPAEQREIAALLATLDAKIAHHEARQALLRELFRTLLHDLLTARRRVTSLDLDDHFADASKMVSATP